MAMEKLKHTIDEMLDIKNKMSNIVHDIMENHFNDDFVSLENIFKNTLDIDDMWWFVNSELHAEIYRVDHNMDVTKSAKKIDELQTYWNVITDIENEYLLICKTYDLVKKSKI